MTKLLSTIERQYLRDRLREFETTVSMTLPERNALRRWVREGHDVNTNPWGYCDDDGWEMNYLEAFRTDLVEYELMKEMAEER